MRQPLPQKVEGDETPWTEEMGCPLFTSSSVRPRTHRSFTNEVLDPRASQSVRSEEGYTGVWVALGEQAVHEMRK